MFLSKKQVKYICLLVFVAMCGVTISALAAEPKFEFTKVDTLQFRKPAPWKVGFCNASVSNPWRIFFVKSIEYEFSKHPEVELLITDAMDNPTKQIADAEDLLAKGIDLLLISPFTDKPLTPIVEKAMAMGVPVVCVDRSTASDDYVSFVTGSQSKLGEEWAKFLVEELNGEGNVVMMGGIAGVGAAEDRIKAGKEVFAKYPKINILHVAYTDWSPVKGKKIMSDLLVRFPKIDGVWSGGVQCIGEVEAFVDAGRPVPPITGEDMNGWLKQCKELGFKFLSVTNCTWQGEVAARLCIDILEGVAVPHYLEVPPTFITQENIDQFVDMDAPDDWWMDNHLPDEWLPSR